MGEVTPLKYPYGREIFHNVMGAHAPSGAVWDLASRSTCPYCQSPLRTVLEESRPYCYETVSVELVVCDGCRWWRKRWVPERFFVGETEVGVLHVPGAEAVSRAAEALAAFEHDAHWSDWTPTTVEKEVASILAAASGAEAVHVGRAGDGGIDILLFDTAEGPIAVQVKHRRSDRRAESVGVVRELRGAMVLRGLSRGMVVTTATRFSHAARDAARAASDHSVQQTIDLVDARRLLDTLSVIVGAGQGDDVEPLFMIDEHWPSSGPQCDETVVADFMRNYRRVERRGLYNGYVV
jgi:Restriction endonuclease